MGICDLVQVSQLLLAEIVDLRQNCIKIISDKSNSVAFICIFFTTIPIRFIKIKTK